MVRWSEEEYEEYQGKKPKKSKYKNTRVFFNEKSGQVMAEAIFKALLKEKEIKEDDFIKFDSMMECDYYRDLLYFKKIGEVIEIELQPKFTLIPKFIKNGITVSAITYSADFKIEYKDGKKEVIDTKGAITNEFKLKWKLFEYKYPDLNLKVINKHGEVIPLRKGRKKHGENIQYS